MLQPPYSCLLQSKVGYRAVWRALLSFCHLEISVHTHTHMSRIGTNKLGILCYNLCHQHE